MGRAHGGKPIAQTIATSAAAQSTQNATVSQMGHGPTLTKISFLYAR
jgi:hypothetical protein